MPRTLHPNCGFFSISAQCQLTGTQHDKILYIMSSFSPSAEQDPEHEPLRPDKQGRKSEKEENSQSGKIRKARNVKQSRQHRRSNDVDDQNRPQFFEPGLKAVGTIQPGCIINYYQHNRVNSGYLKVLLVPDKLQCRRCTKHQIETNICCDHICQKNQQRIKNHVNNI